MAHLKTGGMLRYGEVFLLLVPREDGTNELVGAIDPSKHGFDEEKTAAFGRTQVQAWTPQFPEIFLGMDKPSNQKNGFRNARRV